MKEPTPFTSGRCTHSVADEERERKWKVWCLRATPGDKLKSDYLSISKRNLCYILEISVEPGVMAGWSSSYSNASNSSDISPL